MNMDKIKREIEKRHDAILKELHAKPKKTKTVPVTEKSNTESVAEGVPSGEAVLIAPAAPKLTRAQIKERAQLAYQSGVANLRELADEHGVPYETVRGWSEAEQWTSGRIVTQEAAAATLPHKAGSWLLEKQQEQIERSIKRALSLQCKADDAIRGAEEKDELTPQAVRDSATTEEKLDAIIRRNLSMDTQAQGGARLNLNVLGNVSLISPM